MVDGFRFREGNVKENSALSFNNLALDLSSHANVE